MKKILSAEVNSRLFIIAILVSFFLTYQLIFATFTPPSQVPPLGNVTPPLNTSNSDQVKDGGLSLGSLLVLGGSFFSGDMGIGIISPNSELDVAGTIQAEQLEITNPAVDYRIYTSTSGDLYTMNVLGEDMIQMIDAGASSEVDAQATLDFLYTTTGMGGVKNKLGFVGYNNSTDNILSLTSEINGPLQLKTNNLPRLTILGDGSIGIGNTSPVEKLEVNGNIKVSTGFDVCIDAGNCLSTGGGASEINDLTDGKTGGSSVFLGSGAGANDDGTANLNTAVGSSALNANTTGYSNSALGINALKSNTTGNSNVALGKGALYSNTTGERNIAVGNYALYDNIIGDRNTVLGGNALANNTSGSFNTSAGSYTLYDNTTGGYNSTQGSFTLAGNISGNYNTAIGYDGGRYLANGSTENTTGDYNVFLGASTKALTDNDQNEIVIGYDAIGNGSNTVTLGNNSIIDTYLKGDITIPTGKDICITGGNCLSTVGGAGASEINDLTDGKTGGYSVFLGTHSGVSDDGTDNYNTAIGYESLFKTNTGEKNTAIGYKAGRENTIGTANTALGYSALLYNSDGDGNTAIGVSALRDNVSGDYNTAVGYRTLEVNLGAYNSAIGYKTLAANTTGYGNTANGYSSMIINMTGVKNTAIGYKTLYTNHDGGYNVALGFQSLYNNITGDRNTAVGYESLFSNTGDYNTANGYQSLYSNTTGNYNTALGYFAGRYTNAGTGNQTSNNSLYLGYGTRASLDGNTNETVIGYNAQGNGSNSVTLGNDSILNTYLKGDVTIPTGKDICISGGNCLSTAGGAGASAINDLTDGKTGGSNVFLGSGAGANNTIGFDNVTIGDQSLYSNIDGFNNVAIGDQSLYSNIDGFNNVAIGSDALWHNTTGFANVATGSDALGHNTTGFANVATGQDALHNNTIGTSNVATGSDALRYNISGTNNVATGSSALYNNTTGTGNVATGRNALRDNTIGTNNIATGQDALHYNNTGDYNIAIGYRALLFSTTGTNNIATGQSALSFNSTGTNNIAIGYRSLLSNDSGNENTAIGYNSNVSGSNFTNATALGANATVTASNRVRIGNTSVTRIGGQVAWSNLSDARLKKNVEDSSLGLDFIQKLRPVTFNFKEGQTDILYTGLIAQEVEDALNGIEFSGLNKPENEGDYYSLGYASFVTPLINAVQEIWNKVFTNQEKISELEERIKVLEEIILNNN